MAWFVLCMGMDVGRKGDLDAFLGSDEDSGDFHNKAKVALLNLAERPRGKLLLNVISELVTKEFYSTTQADKRIRIRPVSTADKRDPAGPRSCGFCSGTRSRGSRTHGTTPSSTN